MSYKAPYKWIFKRDVKSHLFQLVDKAGDPYDLTSVLEITLTVRGSDTESAAVVFSCTETGGDIVVTDAVNGKIRVDVITEDTSSETPGEKVYDIQVQDALSQDKTFGKGVYEIVQDITHT